MDTIPVTGRADLTDQQWAVLEPLLPRGKKPGRPPKWSRRQLIDGIRWRVRVGSPWRDVPPQYGPWQTVYGLFRRWQRDGTWRAILTGLQARADARGLIAWDVSIDSTAARAQQHAAAPAEKGDLQREPPGGIDTEPDDHALGRSRGGWTTKLHLSCEQGRKPLSILISAGQRGDSPQFTAVIERIRVPRPGVGRPRTRPDRVLADKAYSSKANRAYLRRRGIKATIPIKDDQAAHRRRMAAKGGRPPAFDTQIYKQRHAVECGINRLKNHRAGPLASTSSLYATKLLSRSQRSTSGSNGRPDCHALSASLALPTGFCQAHSVDRNFSGEVATYYARYRRGYPPAAVDAIVEAFGLGDGDLVVDLGCGSGQLSLPLAAQVRAVVGMDPEPDMLMHARRTANERGVANAWWILAADSDLPTLGHLLGDRTVGAVTIALAIHWMDRDSLFRAIGPLLRPAGGIAVVTNGTPLWLQDSEWSRTLAECLGQWTGKRPTESCQTDEAGRQLNREALISAGYRVVESAVDYDAELTIDEVVGGVFSAMSGDRMPPPQRREEFAAQVRDALARHEPLTEHVRVSLQFGHSA